MLKVRIVLIASISISVAPTAEAEDGFCMVGIQLENKALVDKALRRQGQLASR
jgi:hypothetical protein